MTYIYLHGFASGPDSTKARFFRDRLAALGIPLLVPDLSAGDFERLSITGQLAVIEDLVRGPAALIGSSMGGYLAALYAANHPEIARLILMAPAFGFSSRWSETLGAEAVEQWRQTGYLEVYHYGEERPRRLSCSFLEDAALYPEFPSFSQPALIFHGTEDEVVPSAYSRKFAARHTNVVLRMLASGHQLLDVLESVWAESAAFLFPQFRAHQRE